MKKCKTCSKVLSLGNFYKHAQMKDGLLNHCKTCVKTRVHVYRIKNIERIRLHDRKRGALQHRREKAAEYQRQNRKQHVEANKRWRTRNPEKYKAHAAVRQAVKNRTLEKKACEVCAAQKVEAHHPDYAQPLKIIWLCSKHHAELHKQQREQTRRNT